MSKFPSLGCVYFDDTTTQKLSSKITSDKSGSISNNNDIRDTVDINTSQLSVTYNNQAVNSNNQKSFARIVLKADKISDEIFNYRPIDRIDIDAITDLVRKMDELNDLANRNVNNPEAALVTAEELPLINNLIKNSCDDNIRYHALWSILNGVVHHHKQLEESSINLIKNILADKNANEKLQKSSLISFAYAAQNRQILKNNIFAKELQIHAKKSQIIEVELQKSSLIGLAYAAKNGQVLADNIIDEVNEFINSNLAEQAILVCYYAKNHSNISEKTIDALEKFVQNSNENKELQRFAADIIIGYCKNIMNLRK